MGMNVAGALGESVQSVTIGQKTFALRELDLNDLVDAERMGLDVNGIALGNMEQARAILWLSLRKSDPDLSEEDRENGNYKITEREIGKIFTARILRDNPAILTDILSSSGFIGENPTSGNDTAGE